MMCVHERSPHIPCPEIASSYFQVHASTDSKDFRYFAQIRRVCKSFNALVEPIIFRHVTIHPTLYFTALEAPSRWGGIHIERIQSLASFRDVSATLTLASESEGTQKGRQPESVWRWTQSLRIRNGHLMGDAHRVNEDDLKTLVRAIRAFKVVKHVE